MRFECIYRLNLELLTDPMPGGLQGKMEADERQQLVQQGKAFKDQLVDMEARLQSSKDRLQVHSWAASISQAT